MTINEFAKLNFIEKMALIEQKAVLIDSYPINEQHIKTYYLNDFFLEVIAGIESQYITDIIPYKRGFKVNKENASRSLNA